jgi:glycosyltransferase involved in cell wall biosynthesis
MNWVGMKDLRGNGMLRVLSIQSDILGNKIYSEVLRKYLNDTGEVAVDSHWYNTDRSLPTRVINRMASFSTPILDTHGRNFDLRRARVEWSYGRTSRILTQRLLAAGDYQLLHFHTQIQAYSALSVMKRIPTVITTDMTAVLASRQTTTQFPSTYRINIELDRGVFRAAAHTVVFTDWARRSVIEDYGISPDKVTVIPPGSRLETFSEPSFTKHSTIKILFIGGDFTRKGGWDLLEVFAKSFQGRAELHLVTTEKISSPLANVFVHNNIYPYSSAWHEILHTSDILAVPSYAEPYGLVFQEAGGYGLALIGGRVGGIPEIIIEGESGFLVNPGNHQQLREALNALISNPALLDTMRKKSRRIALERFDAKRNTSRLATRLVEVYQHSRSTG